MRQNVPGHRHAKTRALVGLLVAAAWTLLSPSAFAQPKKPKAPAKPPAAAPAAPAAAPAGGDSIEIDDPNAAKAPDPNAPAGDVTTPPAGGATGGGICDIDPSACPKAGDIKAAAGKKINAEVYAVQQIYALRSHRIELQPYWMATLNDQFVSHPGPGIAANYYISNVLAFGANFNFYQGLNVDSDFNFQNRRATRVAVPINEYQLGAAFNATYVPMYGKFAGFGQFIFHYDAYIVGGVGILRDRPIPVIDPDNRKFDYKTNIAFNGGLGLRIFINRWFAATLEVRDYVFNEQLEALTVAPTQAQQTNPATWTGENRFTNNVQAQLGVSIFLPFSWEYRLPK